MITAVKQRLQSLLPHANKEVAVVSESRVRAIAGQLIGLRQQARSIPLDIHKILSSQSGAYLSPFRGRGMEYDQSRLYQAGDDIRNVDWRVTARSGKTYTKQFREERERAVIMWVDYRQPMRFATRGVFKSVLAARAATLLSWSAVQQGDRVGGLIFDEYKHRELRPSNGDKGALHIIKQLCHFDDHGQPGASVAETTDGSATAALLRLRRVARPGSMVFLISDFHELGEQGESHLMQLTRHNDVIMIFIYDPLESELPAAGRYRISDGVHERELDAGNKAVRREHQDRFKHHVGYLQSLSRRYGMSLIQCATDQDIEQMLRTGLRLKRI